MSESEEVVQQSPKRDKSGFFSAFEAFVNEGPPVDSSQHSSSDSHSIDVAIETYRQMSVLSQDADSLCFWEANSAAILFFSHSCHWLPQLLQFARANNIQSFRCKAHPLRPRKRQQRSISRTFYANNGWLRRPGPWPGAEAVTQYRQQKPFVSDFSILGGKF